MTQEKETKPTQVPVPTPVKEKDLVTQMLEMFSGSILLTIIVLLTDVIRASNEVLDAHISALHSRLILAIFGIIIVALEGFSIKKNKKKWVSFVLSLLIEAYLIFLLFIPHPNLVYLFDFEPGTPYNDCWRLREDENENTLGKGIAITDEVKLYGKQSLRVDLSLQEPMVEDNHTPKAQVDLEEASAAFTGTWLVPYDGSMQAWVCLPASQSDSNTPLMAEFFLQFHPNEQYNEAGELNGLDWHTSQAVELIPGEWTLLRWDATHDTAERWRNWDKLYLQSRPVSVGIEFKPAGDASGLRSFEGYVFLDEFAILKTSDPYRLFPKTNLTKSCP